jgi:Na+-transporting NADH:ubiquinone oxidoreductase subunit NqrD
MNKVGKLTRTAVFAQVEVRHQVQFFALNLLVLVATTLSVAEQFDLNTVLITLAIWVGLLLLSCIIMAPISMFRHSVGKKRGYYS